MMRKLAIAAIVAAFAATSVSVPMFSEPAYAASKKKAKKKASAGKCGTYMYYSMKTRKCSDARSKK
ncbi:MAG: hypothetical protein AB7O43_13825 [Hyphomicrobiaceae bacterium]